MDEIKDILDGAFHDLRSLRDNAKRELVEHYAPKLQAIRAEENDATRREMLDDVLTNVKLSASIAGVGAETLTARTIVRIVIALAKFAAVAV